MDWNYYFYFDEGSPTRLRWKIDILRFGGTVQIPKDSVAGCLSLIDGVEKSAGLVQCKGKLYKIHRVVWEMFNGPIPDGVVVDHLDGNPWNNSLDNLRITTVKINSQNQKKRSTNKSGKTGVHWVTKKKGKYEYKYACASVSVSGSNFSKCFSVNKLGEDSALLAAIKWRNEEIERLNNLGNNYTERHGK